MHHGSLTFEWVAFGFGRGCRGLRVWLTPTLKPSTSKPLVDGQWCECAGLSIGLRPAIKACLGATDPFRISCRHTGMMCGLPTNQQSVIGLSCFQHPVRPGWRGATHTHVLPRHMLLQLCWQTTCYTLVMS